MKLNLRNVFLDNLPFTSPLQRLALPLAAISVLAISAPAQSTLGSISGAVQDSSGARVPNATIKLHRTDNNTDRTLSADDTGQYSTLNLEPGTYDITVTREGLGSTTATGIVLQARQQLRYDVTLNVQATQSVTVSAEDAGVIDLDNAQISAVLTPQAVLDLPANYRGAGSTSPLSVVQALPGVQPDSGSYPPAPSTHPVPAVRYSIQGGLPSQTETTVDGISAQNQTSNNVQADAFPSAESVAEIRVDGVNNNAEYGQPGEITTVTKSGTNRVHGSAYMYYQNSALDATPYGSDASTKPYKDAKDFGGSIGLPIRIPHLYDGRNKSFLFGAYEGLRYPQTTTIQDIVPTVRMKQGDFSQEDAQPLRNPFTGGFYANNRVPINAASAKFLQFYPDPNIDANLSTAAANADRGYNYLSSRRNDIRSNQFDVRGDQVISSKASASARYSYKNNDQSQYVDLTLPNSTAFARYRILASNFNYAITQRLANEFKFGFTLEDDGNSNPFDGPGFTASTGLQGLSTPAFFNGIPHLQFNAGAATPTSIGSRLSFDERSRVFQYIDNLTYARGSHTLRFGVDIRHLQAFTEAGGSTPSINYGTFNFDANHSATNDQFADFLVGVPYISQPNTIRSDNNASTNSYAFYAQDSWKATQNLTLNYGLRYELHPALASVNGLAGNFDPSIARTGRLIYPAGYASSLDVQELANVNACPTAGITNPYATGQPAFPGVGCTPIVTNVQAGLPAGLRKTPILRFMPRFGFAYQPFGDGKTVIRGGASYYNITTTGALFYAIAQTLQQNYQYITNGYSNPDTNGGVFAAPTFSFPNTTASNTFTPAPGSAYFYAAVDTNWHDPYSLQTNLSLDHDFGHNLGGRISYVGMHTWHLVWQPQFNQLAKSNSRLAANAPATDYPFPNFYQITRRSTGATADYRSLQGELTKRLSNGFSIDSVYTLAKNLADNQGTNGNYTTGSGFVDEQGGYNPTDSTNAAQDYGNVAGTRRHRSLTTVIYELPFGRGKMLGNNLNGIANAFVGGWQLSGIVLWQTGPFLTAAFPAGTIDPAGNGSGTYVGGANMRPDRIRNANTGPRNRNAWVSKSAFACPGSGTDLNTNSTCDVGIGSLPIGRYGTEGVGDIHGPNTTNFSTGLSKSFLLAEGVRVRTEGTFTNVLNHTNLADPDLNLTSTSFGKITQSRGSDFGGNRTGQVSFRVEF